MSRRNPQVAAALQATVSAWGRLDRTVNAAGVEGATRELLDEDDALFAHTPDVNVRGVGDQQCAGD